MGHNQEVTTSEVDIDVEIAEEGDEDGENSMEILKVLTAIGVLVAAHFCRDGCGS